MFYPTICWHFTVNNNIITIHQSNITVIYDVIPMERQGAAGLALRYICRGLPHRAVPSCSYYRRHLVVQSPGIHTLISCAVSSPHSRCCANLSTSRVVSSCKLTRRRVPPLSNWSSSWTSSWAQGCWAVPCCQQCPPLCDTRWQCGKTSARRGRLAPPLVELQLRQDNSRTAWPRFFSRITHWPWPH